MILMRYMVTFGAGQPNANHYMFVYADNEDAAREKVYGVYGQRWSNIYPPGAQEWVTDPILRPMTEISFGCGVVEADVIRWARTVPRELL